MKPFLKIRNFIVAKLMEKTDFEAVYWARRKRAVIEGYWNLRSDDSNQYVLDMLAPFQFQSLIELGSNCGARLSILAERWPEARLVGIDINAFAVDYGNEKLSEMGMCNVALKKGRIEELGQFPDESFDICLTWASLIYIRPKHIRNVLQQMLRITRKALVLLEVHNESLVGEMEVKGKLSGGRNWARNYRWLFESLGIPGKAISVSDIPKSVWSPGGGGAVCIIVKK